MCQAMIVSLGGTPEPIVRTLCEHRPTYVCFLASQQSVYVLGQVKELLKAEGCTPQDSRTVLPENVDDLPHCYGKALEMPRIAFFQQTGVSTSEAPLSAVPEGMRHEYGKLYMDDEKQVLKIPLFGVFRLLQKLDDPAGRQFFANEKEFLRILNARNNSILAHGMQPVKASTYEALDRLIRSSFGIDKIVKFPCLTSPF